MAGVRGRSTQGSRKDRHSANSFVSLPDLYRISDSTLSNEDIFRLLAEPVPPVTAIFNDREKYEFTIYAAELHKSKSGEPLTALYEGVSYVIGGRAAGPRSGDRVLRADVFAVLPVHHSETSEQSTNLRTVSLDVDQEASRGILALERRVAQGVRVSWNQRDGFELSVRLSSPGLRHGKTATLTLQIDAYESEGEDALSISRATCTVRLMRDYIERRMSDRRKSAAACNPYTVFANRPPLGPSAFQLLMMARPASGGVTSSSTFATAAVPNMSAVPNGAGGTGSAQPPSPYSPPPLPTRLYWRSNSVRDTAGLDIVLGRQPFQGRAATEMRRSLTSPWSSASSCGENSVSAMTEDRPSEKDTVAAETANGTGDKEDGQVSSEDVETVQRNMDALNLSCGATMSANAAPLHTQDAQNRFGRAVEPSLLSGRYAGQHTIHSSQPSTYEPVHVFRGFAEAAGTRASHRARGVSRFKVKRVESSASKHRTKGHGSHP